MRKLKCEVGLQVFLRKGRSNFKFFESLPAPNVLSGLYDLLSCKDFLNLNV